MNRQSALSVLGGGAAIALHCAPAGAADQTARVALLPIDTDAVAYYGHDLGYFEQSGVDAEISVIQAGATIAAAILGGSVDIGFVNPMSLGSAHLSGIPLVAIAPGGLYLKGNPTAAIVVPKDSTIKSARDFNGKTFACSGLKSVGQLAPAAWIDKNGGDSRTVKFVEMPFPDMPAALAQKRIDAAFPAEPFVTLSKDVGYVFADAYAAVGPRFLIGVWVTSMDWANAHKDGVAKFAQAIGRAAAWANTHHAESATILAKYGKLDAAVTRSMLRVPYAERLTPGDLQPMLDLATHYGSFNSRVPADQLIYKP